jgi:hypothetical protein
MSSLTNVIDDLPVFLWAGYFRYCACFYMDDIFAFLLILCIFIILYFYKGCNITVKFFTWFYDVVYLLSTDKPTCAYNSYVLCVLYKCI